MAREGEMTVWSPSQCEQQAALQAQIRGLVCGASLKRALLTLPLKALFAGVWESGENPMDGGAWWAAVHGVAKSWTRLSDFTFTFHSPALEKEMATHSSVLAWRIPETGEPGGLPSMGSHRVGQD